MTKILCVLMLWMSMVGCATDVASSSTSDQALEDRPVESDPDAETMRLLAERWVAEYGTEYGTEERIAWCSRMPTGKRLCCIEAITRRCCIANVGEWDQIVYCEAIAANPWPLP